MTSHQPGRREFDRHGGRVAETRRARPPGVLVPAVCLIMAIAFGLPSPAHADGWITAWSASQHPRFSADFILPNTPPKSVTNQTIRQVVRLNLGGGKIRVVISNEYNSLPLVLGAASVATADAEGKIVAGSSQTLTFFGTEEIRIPQGARVISDPIERNVAALDSLAISLFFPNEAFLDTYHFDGAQTAYISGPGNFVADTAFAAVAAIPSRMLLSGVMVEAPANAKAIVLFGDSITDGNCSTVDMNHRYPDFLAERLHAEGHANVALINAGVSGARLFKDGMGESALARLDTEVFGQPGVSTMVMMLASTISVGPPWVWIPGHQSRPAPRSRRCTR